MAGKKTISTVLLVVGIVLLLLSVLADVIGIGNQTGFGAWQIAGTLAGGILALVGLLLMLKR